MKDPNRTSKRSLFFVLCMASAVPLSSVGCSNSGPTADSAPTPQKRAGPIIQEAKHEPSEVAVRLEVSQPDDARDAAESNRKSGGEGAEAQVNANVEVRTANRRTARATTDLREWSQKRLDDLDNAIDSARAKEQTASPDLRSTFETGIKGVELRRNALRAEIGSIKTQSAKDMDDFKDRFDKESNRLQHRVDELSGAL